MSLRREFVMLARQEGANMRELCRRYRIQPRIGYKWVERYAQEGETGLVDRSRRPQRSPARTGAAMEALVVAMRDEHSAWGGRKLRRRLQDLGHQVVPSASTITAILHRHHLIEDGESGKHRAFERFEHAAPNQLWQMDFKGHFATLTGRCHPLTMLDDHSRFAVALQACADERRRTVEAVMTAVFRRYGLPDRMLMDNGAPWGNDTAPAWTRLTVWLLRLGIGVTHGRPYHPQTQGKDERFHRTLQAEVIDRRVWRDPAQCQTAFDEWRHVYNAERPHEALGLATPATRYQPSRRSFPETLPAIDYGPGAIVRKVQNQGRIFFANNVWKVGKAFEGQPVAVRPTLVDGRYDVVFCQHKIAELDLRGANR
jgi:transposase InsO family protein